MAATAILSVVLLGGCRSAFPPDNKPVELMDEQRPLVIDQATQDRNYDRSTLYYPNGAVLAGHPRLTFTTPINANGIDRAAVDPVLFVVNMALIPFTYFALPPMSSYDWHGAITDPTYSAQPAYPTENSTPPEAIPDVEMATPAPVVAPDQSPTADQPAGAADDTDATTHP